MPSSVIDPQATQIPLAGLQGRHLHQSLLRRVPIMATAEEPELGHTGSSMGPKAHAGGLWPGFGSRARWWSRTPSVGSRAGGALRVHTPDEADHFRAQRRIRDVSGHSLNPKYFANPPGVHIRAALCFCPTGSGVGRARGMHLRCIPYEVYTLAPPVIVALLGTTRRCWPVLATSDPGVRVCSAQLALALLAGG